MCVWCVYNNAEKLACVLDDDDDGDGDDDDIHSSHTHNDAIDGNG